MLVSLPYPVHSRRVVLCTALPFVSRYHLLAAARISRQRSRAHRKIGAHKAELYERINERYKAARVAAGNGYPVARSYVFSETGSQFRESVCPTRRNAMSGRGVYNAHLIPCHSHRFPRRRVRKAQKGYIASVDVFFTRDGVFPVFVGYVKEFDILSRAEALVYLEPGGALSAVYINFNAHRGTPL